MFLALERSSLLGCASNRQYLKNLGSRSLWSPRPSVQMTGDQLLAIGKQDLQHTPEGLPILDWLQSDGNFVARLEGVLTKATGGYASRRLSLHNPMNYWSVIIVYVESQEAMGIGPRPSCDGPLHGNSLPDVELSVAMVCEQRNRNDQKANNHSGSCDRPPSHGDCLQSQTRISTLTARMGTVIHL